ncbi:MAG: hypothetical protein ACXVBO_22865, partial [Isosphaeraceae bacterium]
IPARAAIAARSVARFGGIGEDHEWLFPGPIHGRPITTSTMTRRLRAIGLEPAPARSAAMGQLAMQLPPAILARLTGITVARAAVWHAATSASQARNLPDGPSTQSPGRYSLTRAFQETATTDSICTLAPSGRAAT